MAFKLGLLVSLRRNHDKNETLKVERNICFEEMVLAIESDGLLDVLHHSNLERYPGQFVFVISLNSYIYLALAGRAGGAGRVRQQDPERCAE